MNIKKAIQIMENRNYNIVKYYFESENEEVQFYNDEDLIKFAKEIEEYNYIA